MFDITIIVDKSTFHSLNFDELYRLSCYYKHVITPVLTMEILGDLKKEAGEGKTPSEERVKDFATKLFPLETIVNLHYKELLKGDLMGTPVSFDGRPHVGIEKAVESETGMRGYLIKETQEEKSIAKWKEGKFSEADRELSSMWRMRTTQEDLLSNIKRALKISGGLKFKNIEELDDAVTKTLCNPTTQQFNLLGIIQNYDINHYEGSKILERWALASKPLIKDFAPYAFHCLRVDTLFYFGLASELISTRPTNRVDIEYLYYLPFGNIFTSDDKLHKLLTPLLLMPYQKFIPKTELKKDLSIIVEYLEKLPIEERKKYKNEPPIIEESLTFQLWKEYFGYPERSNMNRDVSPERLEMMKEKMQEFERALEGEEINLAPEEDASFVVHKTSMKKTDLCFCGSGKIVIQCCIPNDEFDRIAFQEEYKKWQKRTGRK